MLTCFPSKAPKQFRKFQRTLKPFSISCHLSRVGSGITSFLNVIQIALQVSLMMSWTVDNPILNRVFNITYESPEARNLQLIKHFCIIFLHTLQSFHNYFCIIFLPPPHNRFCIIFLMPPTHNRFCIIFFALTPCFPNILTLYPAALLKALFGHFGLQKDVFIFGQCKIWN